jgi:hypothetical protein
MRLELECLRLAACDHPSSLTRNRYDTYECTLARLQARVFDYPRLDHRKRTKTKMMGDDRPTPCGEKIHMMHRCYPRSTATLGELVNVCDDRTQRSQRWSMTEISLRVNGIIICRVVPASSVFSRLIIIPSCCRRIAFLVPYNTVSVYIIVPSSPPALQAVHFPSTKEIKHE